MNTVMIMLVLLLLGHFLADYALQGDFMAKAKNRANPIPGVPWYQVMFAHVFIHGAFVFLITGMWQLMAVEMAVHFITDDAKCKGKIDYNTDQAIHLLCKVAYVAIAFLTLT